MKLRDLSVENPDHSYDKHALFTFHGLGIKITEKKDTREQFIANWLSGKARLKDWVSIKDVDFNAIEKAANLTETQVITIQTRRRQLYDWFIEYKLQKVIMKRLFTVIQNTPFYSLQFAEKELYRVETFLAGGLKGNPLREFASFYKVFSGLKLDRLSYEHEWSSNSCDWDIHSRKGYIEIEMMKRYRNYLQQFIKDLGTVETANPFSADDQLTFFTVFTGLVELCTKIIIGYSHGPFVINGKETTLYDLIDVCGCERTPEFKNLIREKLREGFAVFIYRLQYVSLNQRARLYQEFLQDAADLKRLIVDGEFYVEGESEQLSQILTFKKFSGAKFKGTNDGVLAFDDKAMSFLLREAEVFAEAWLEMVDEIVRRLEHASYSLDLMQFVQDARELDRPSSMSFEYVHLATNSDAIVDLYNAMKKGGLIEQSTGVHNFKRVLSGKEVVTPIVWTGTMEELVYFIKQVHQKKKKVKNVGRRHWEITHHCFIRPNGSRFDKAKFRTQKTPASCKQIEAVVDLL